MGKESLTVDRVLELGREHLEKGAFHEAAECFQSIRERSPMRWESHVGLGHALFKAGKLVSALNVVPDAIRVEPTCIPAYQLLAYIGMHGGMPDRVIEWIEHGAQAMSEQPLLFEWLVHLYAMDNRELDLRNCLEHYARLRGLSVLEVGRFFSRDSSIPDDIRRRIVSAAGY